MKRARTIFLLTLLATLAASPALATGNANFVLGGRILDEDDWEPVDTMPAFGVNIDFGLFGWPVDIAVGLHGSSDEGDVDLPGGEKADVTGTVWDLSVGVTKRWLVAGNIHPYVGGGLAYVQAEQEADFSSGGSASDDDASGALYLDWGIYWRLGDRFNLGVDARFVGLSDLTIGDDEISADYFQAGLLLGWGWGD